MPTLQQEVAKLEKIIDGYLVELKTRSLGLSGFVGTYSQTAIQKVIANYKKFGWRVTSQKDNGRIISLSFEPAVPKRKRAGCVDNSFPSRIIPEEI